jgi:hypothetical protein
MTAPPHRLVSAPVFILSSIRSGSTLLRCLLDTHSMICAPHELHLQGLRVEPTTPYVRSALDAMTLPVREVEHMLWDRVLHRLLADSGKEVIVDKTPGNLVDWPRLAECWPHARYVFLIRHPANIVASAVAAFPDRRPNDTTAIATELLDRLDEARRALQGMTVRYEDLTADPAAATQAVCRFLGVPWEESMLAYGTADHGPFRRDIGDFAGKIASGRVQAGRPLPPHAAVPADLRERCRRWGYL